MNLPLEPVLIIDYLYENKIRRLLTSKIFPVYLKRGEMKSWEGIPVIVITFPVDASLEDTTLKNLRRHLMDVPDNQYALYDNRFLVQGSLDDAVHRLSPSITQYEPLLTPR